MAVGRISGPLLKANLLRNGVDLAFETDLLYLDVNNLRIGIKTNNPTHDLHVDGTTRTQILEATTSAVVGQTTISGSTISTTNNQLNLSPAGTAAVVYQKKAVIDSIDLENNSITVNQLNTDLELEANGTGKVKVFSDMLVNGNIHATGDITADGNIVIGDSDTDSINFVADVASNIIPDVTDFYNLGSPSKRWKDLHVDTIRSDTLILIDDLQVDGVSLDTRPGNMLFVGTNGDDTLSGTHQNDPFRTVKHALSQATSGTTVLIYPGVYQEIFPLTVPAGVTLKGVGLRSVKITPTPATLDKDAILLNGETTIEDLTIADFRFNSTNNTGYAFKFASNFTVTARSPYIKNISVITQGSTTTSLDPRGFLSGDAGKGAFLDGSIATAGSKEASCLFHSVTFICPGADAITATNGVRIEWLNSFTYFAEKSLYGYSGSTGFAGQGKTSLRLENLVGTIAAGDILTYYDTDGTTVIATANVDSVAPDGKIFLSGKATGFVTAEERGGKTIIANGDAKLSQSIKKFGSASLSLDGTGDYVTVPSTADFNFGTGDFTIECWIYRSISNVQHNIFDFRTTNTQNAPVVYIQNTNQLTYYVNGSIRITGTTVSTGVWHHVALSRQGTSTKLFFNGAQVGSTWTDTTNYIQSPLTIGSRFDGISGNFNGYIDDLRIIKGVGLYTTTFPAPTTRAFVTPETVLMARFDGADNSTVFEDDVVYTQDIRSNNGATATKISLTDFSDFGVEVRSIASASIYGESGAVGNGEGVVMYLIGHNMAYVGTQYRTDNDNTYVVQANEVITSNNAKIYYSSVDHKGDFRVGDLFYVDQANGTVNFTSATFNLSSTQGITLVDGSNVTFLDGNKIETGNLRLSGNTLESITGDINIDAASSQINMNTNVNISGNLDVTGNVTIGGNIIIGDQNTDSINFVGGITSDLIPNANNTYDIGSDPLRWKDVYAYQLNVGNLTVTNNNITTPVTNGNIEISANGTGFLSIDNLEIQDSEIRSISNSDITLTPNGSGMVVIDSTVSLKIPVGISNDRPLTPQSGMIRFNSTLNRYEGYNGTSWVFLDGISDLDGNTYVTAELTPGANDNTIRFYADGNLVANVNQNGFTIPKINVDDIVIDNNSISNTASNTLSIQTTGNVTINNFSLSGTTITNTVNNSITSFVTTGTGYFSVPGTGAMVIPSGVSIDRPGNAVVGMMRFDTINNRLEVYDGLNWISAAGSAVGITRPEAEDIAVGIALIFG
jgi:hypothetical protein